MADTVDGCCPYTIVAYYSHHTTPTFSTEVFPALWSGVQLRGGPHHLTPSALLSLAVGRSYRQLCPTQLHWKRGLWQRVQGAAGL